MIFREDDAMIKQFLNDPKLLLNAVGEGIYGFDLSGNAVFVNQPLNV